MAEETNVLELLAHEHRGVDELFQRIDLIDAGARELRRDLADQVTSMLIRHTVAEEAIVYPALAEHDEREAARARDDHAEVEAALKKLEQLSADSDEFTDVLRTVIDNVREHIAEEEGPMFDELRTSYSE
ncbi:hemerythrin domain-containing protein [Tomitella gaofuii]|uniref:hemerythrin domain-containing protein n=1 Tax=Tomitella gaofuii TaxID=2760083 RepID=UPI0015FE53D5|nr:hemerythrin domain-containing protein [Tomitella gaofuii]